MSPEHIPVLSLKDAYRSPHYREQFGYTSKYFLSLVLGSPNWNFAPLGIPEYSDIQEQALAAAYAIVLSPVLLRWSHCNHRTVSSCLVQHFDTHIPFETQLEIARVSGIVNRLACVLASESGDFLFVHGNNNWFDLHKHQQPDFLLNCKIMPGLPQEIGKENLQYLDSTNTLDSLDQIDSACPKRTLGKECRIIHSEASALVHAGFFQEHFNLPPPKKAFLTSTWVPCTKCVNLLLDAPELIGNQLDVFSVYGAHGDEEDMEMAEAIREKLMADKMGRFSGPLVGIGKKAGYGWLPATHEWMATLKESIKASLQIPSYDDADRKLQNFLLQTAELIST
jgi:hypothetical protein